MILRNWNIYFFLFYLPFKLKTGNEFFHTTFVEQQNETSVRWTTWRSYSLKNVKILFVEERVNVNNTFLLMWITPKFSSLNNMNNIQQHEHHHIFRVLPVTISSGIRLPTWTSPHISSGDHLSVRTPVTQWP